MKIRNLPFNKLNNKEKKVVLLHYEEQIKDKQVNCRNMHCVNSVQEFWEIHREMDTENGEYNGWIKPKDELEDIVEKKLKQIKNKKLNFSKYCSNCGEIFGSDNIEEFLEMVEKHICKGKEK